MGSILFAYAAPFHAPAQVKSKPYYSARKIMAGDKIRVNVLEDAGLTKDYTVAGDGTIDFGFVGRIEVAEKNNGQIVEQLKALLEESYFKVATVSVQVSDYVEGDILVMGAVASPHSLPFKGDVAITLMDAVLMCGGLAPGAAGKEVRILRLKPGGGLERESLVADVQTMFETLDFSRDQYLRPRDIVFVPSLGAGDKDAAEFLALGEVGNPGFHPYTEGLDVIRAVMRAGGFTRSGNWEAARILRPGKAGSYSIIPINLLRLFGGADMSMNIAIYAGDILFIPSSEQASRGQIYLLGEVAKQGAVSLPVSQDMTLAKTILANGGFTKFGNDSKVRILRTAPDGTKQTLTVDVGKILKTGAFEDDVPLETGDVIIVPERILGF